MYGNKITIRQYNTDEQRHIDGPTVYVCDVAASIRRPEAAAELLADMVNGGGFTRGSGRRVGRALHEAHNSIHHMIISFLIGILEGLAEIPNHHLDPRNTAAIELAHTIAHSAKHF